MSSLLEKIKSSGKIKASDILSESIFFSSNETIPTELPVLNIAFSGDIHGGIVPGITVFAGESKSFKTFLSIYVMKAYMDKYPDSVALFYDSEFGTPASYLESMGIDTSKVIHIPVTNIEELKFDIVKRLESIERGDKVFIMVDSLGVLASKREVDNAVNENSSADMTRAKEIKSLFRIITPHITMKEIPCVIINHVYKEQTMFPKSIISGGTGVMYSANTAFIISRSQEKQGDDIIGYNFTINVEKSRFVKEKSKLSFQVFWNGGINKYSGLLDIALKSGHVTKPSAGWYSRVNMQTGEVEDKKYRAKDTNTEAFWEPILNDQSFIKYVRSKYKIDKDNFLSDEPEEEQ